MPMMLPNLLAFVRVVEAGSFSTAARQAGTTTSAMSKAITRLERSQGVRLLHRTTHALSLTPEGERLLDGARDLLREALRFEATVAEARGSGAVGRVRLSVPGAFARACLLPSLPSLLDAHPGINLEISFDDAVVDLGATGFDLALRTGDLAGTPGLVARRLFTYPMILCAAPAYLARRGTPGSVSDLDHHDLIGFRNRATGSVMPWLFATADGVVRHVPRTRLVVDDGTAGWSMTREGLGLSWVPSWLGLEDLRAGRVVELLRRSRMPNTPLSIVRLDRRLSPERIGAVLDHLERAAAQWTGW